MKIHITKGATHPAIAGDRAFFSAHPRRRFRAREFCPTELGFPENFVMFAPSERGEINLVILQRIEGGRFRWHFAKPPRLTLNTDAKIEAFLRSRGISPTRRKRLRRRV